jgi:CBS domain-containing protein
MMKHIHVHLRAKDASSRPITLEPDKSLGEARAAMQSCGVDRLVVTDREYRPIGIITGKDIVRLLDTYGSRMRLDRIRLEQVMSKKNPITANEESSLSSCARLMLDNGISSVIITDDRDVLKGICTKINMTSAYARHCAGEHLVQDFMTRKVFTVAQDDTLDQILTLMVNNSVSRVVVTKNQKPVGIITEHDVMPLSALVDPYFNRFVTNAAPAIKEQDFRPGQTQAHVTVSSAIKSIFLARDLMKGDLIMIAKDSDLADAAKMMIGNGISGLPVVDPIDGDNLAGIVTKTDVTRALTCTVGETMH